MEKLQALKAALLATCSNYKSGGSDYTFVELYLSKITGEMVDNASEFIQSLFSWYYDKHRLSEKQAYYLAKFVLETIN